MNTVKRAFAHATVLYKRILQTRGHGAAPLDWREPTFGSRPPYSRGRHLLLAAAVLSAPLALAYAQDYPARPWRCRAVRRRRRLSG